MRNSNMKSSFCVDFLICSVVVWALFGLTEAELEQTKNRRGGGGTSGLFAFPRVGRSDPDMSTNLHELADPAAASAYDAIYPAPFEEYEDVPKSEVKRANLIAFPRVGRSDGELRQWARWLALQQALDKRAAPSATTSGLWFGPRLGKRSVPATAAQQWQRQKDDY